jgi:putative intracellular protease/amidase
LHLLSVDHASGKEILFYIGVWPSLLVPNLNRMHTVSSPCSRKSFFAKLGGMLAVVGIAPALLAKAGAEIANRPVTLRPEPRAVARKEGTC